MSADQAAQAAVALWSPADAVTAVAVAGAESGWTLNAGGDSPDQLRAYYLSHGLPDTSASFLPYTCPPQTPSAFTSWGPWQVNVAVHWGIIPGATPCAKAAYLTGSWAQSAGVAYAVWQGAGWGAWSTYTGGQYRAYLPAARTAVAAALAAGTGGGGTTYLPPGGGTSSPWPDVLAIALLLGLPAAAYVFSTTPRGHAWLTRTFGGRGLRRAPRRR